MTTILDLISETRNHFIDTIERMQANGYPVVLCGAGYVAQLTWEFMQRHDMSVNHIAVSDEYLIPGSTFSGIPIVGFDSLIEAGARYNYIIAMQYIDDTLSARLRQSACEILYYDPTFVGINAKEHFTPAWCEKHCDSLNNFYNSLRDDVSKTTLIAYLNQRISAREDFYHQVYHPEHYFPRELISFGADEVFVDGGAFNGDSIAAFMQALEKQQAGPPAKIFAFEPDAATFKQLAQNTAALSQCICFNAGIWHEETMLRFNASNALSSALTDGPDGEVIMLKKIDAVVAGERVTFIKMDIEGAELDALKGAQETIKTHQPTLAISLYHKPEDLITIPQFIRSLNPDYRFYLRAHHPRLACELVLYAIPAHKIPTL